MYCSRSLVPDFAESFRAYRNSLNKGLDRDVAFRVSRSIHLQKEPRNIKKKVYRRRRSAQKSLAPRLPGLVSRFLQAHGLGLRHFARGHSFGREAPVNVREFGWVRAARGLVGQDALPSGI